MSTFYVVTFPDGKTVAMNRENYIEALANCRRLAVQNDESLTLYPPIPMLAAYKAAVQVEAVSAREAVKMVKGEI